MRISRNIRWIGAAALAAIAAAARLPACTATATVRAGRPEPQCSILCVEPPPGCYYRGGLTTGPCSRVTCGEVVCHH
ncbi:MAG: hypothetical protein IT372_24845 [Polyangiaceae bacterium]|nr:hypothetical protein [Polyangiaceae bacterium]